MSGRHGVSHHASAVVMVFAACCLPWAAASGQPAEAPSSANPVTGLSGGNPPVEQPLVPEGVFAAQLVEALKLGFAPDEATAERFLSDAGIEPKNGWISDYPVTPEIIGDIGKAIVTAAEQHKLAMDKDQALKAAKEVETRLGLAVSPGAKPPEGVAPKPANTTIYSYTDKNGVVHYTDQFDSVPSEYRATARIIRQSLPHTSSEGAQPPEPQYVASPGPDIVNNYYYEEGPPVVTYYMPPDPYYYLYSWVPYPFWYTGFYFPGFFVLNNFHRHVFFHHHRYFVSHHVGDGSFRGTFGGWSRGGNLMAGQPPHPVVPPHWFAAPGAQAGARAIVTLHQNRFDASHATGPRGPNIPSLVAPRNGWAGPVHNRPAVMGEPSRMPQWHMGPPPGFANGGRIFNHPVFNPGHIAPAAPRIYSPPINAPPRSFGAPHGPYGGPVGGFRGSGGSIGGFHGDGGGHGAFGGAHR